MSEDSSDRKQFDRCLEIYGISRYGFSMAYLRSCQDELGRHEWEDGMADMKDSTACESEHLLGGH